MGSPPRLIAEGGAGVANAGVGAAFRTGTIGVAAAAVSALDWHRRSAASRLYASYETQLFGVSLSASSQRTFGAYDDLASATRPAANYHGRRIAELQRPVWLPAIDCASVLQCPQLYHRDLQQRAGADCAGSPDLQRADAVRCQGQHECELHSSAGCIAKSLEKSSPRRTRARCLITRRCFATVFQRFRDQQEHRHVCGPDDSRSGIPRRFRPGSHAGRVARRVPSMPSSRLELSQATTDGVCAIQKAQRHIAKPRHRSIELRHGSRRA